LSASPDIARFHRILHAAGIEVPNDWARGAEANYDHLKSDCEIVRRGFRPDIEPGFFFDPRKICGG